MKGRRRDRSDSTNSRASRGTTRSKDREEDTETSSSGRGSIFYISRPRIFSLDKLPPEEKLLFALNNYFPPQEMRALEDRINEVQHFLSLKLLRELTEHLKRRLSEILLARKRESMNTFESAIEALRREVIIVPTSGRREGSVLKSCLRQSGEAKAQSPGERLVDRLGDLLDPDLLHLVLYRADNLGSKQDLENFIVYIGEMLDERIASQEARARTQVLEAVETFALEITTKERQMKEIKTFMEAMRRSVQLVLKDMRIEEDHRSELFSLSMEVEAEYNGIADEDFSFKTFCEAVDKMIEMLVELAEKVPSEVTLQIREFINLCNTTRGKL